MMVRSSSWWCNGWSCSGFGRGNRLGWVGLLNFNRAFCKYVCSDCGNAVLEDLRSKQDMNMC